MDGTLDGTLNGIMNTQTRSDNNQATEKRMKTNSLSGILRFESSQLLQTKTLPLTCPRTRIRSCSAGERTTNGRSGTNGAQKSAAYNSSRLNSTPTQIVGRFMVKLRAASHGPPEVIDKSINTNPRTDRLLGVGENGNTEEHRPEIEGLASWLAAWSVGRSVGSLVRRRCNSGR